MFAIFIKFDCLLTSPSLYTSFLPLYKCLLAEYKFFVGCIPFLAFPFSFEESVKHNRPRRSYTLSLATCILKGSPLPKERFDLSNFWSFSLQRAISSSDRLPKRSLFLRNGVDRPTYVILLLYAILYNYLLSSSHIYFQLAVLAKQVTDYLALV